MYGKPVAYVRPTCDSSLCGGIAYGHVEVFFGSLENGQARGTSWRDYGDEPRNDLPDLEITNQVSSDGPASSKDGSYGWQCTYKRVYSTDLQRAETMVKTFRAIDRSLDKQRSQLGSPVTFGQYVVRVLRALKIDRVVVLKRNEWPNNQDIEYRVRKPGEVVHLIDELTEDLLKETAKLKQMYGS